ncbi:hypothetical protein PoB_001005900 [Plakobranchus ocellatus]|uniref:Odorant receptor n=1 Tax=Plakobranchus ocellatus TaxID=259542 RepID=A0AAV3YN61_9GAST|nr:hypothetical protein PoB_001005900 [Plakobranchus ocellatus]
MLHVDVTTRLPMHIFIKLELLCVFYAGNEKKRFSMFCPNAANWPIPTWGWAKMSLDDTLLRQDRVAMKTEANMLRGFLRQAMLLTGDQVPVSAPDKGRHPPTQKVELFFYTARLLFKNFGN